MLINPWKFKKVRTILFNRIGDLNDEVKELRNDLRNTEALVESYKNLEKAWKALDDHRIRRNQSLTEIILRSNLADEFSVTDLSMLDE